MRKISMKTNPSLPVLLIILDGFGIRSDPGANAILAAKMPNWDRYVEKYAFGVIDASGASVGLPDGQFGNSEVGHLNIGAGRVVLQDITRIDADIMNHKFFHNPVLINAINKTASGNLHIMGLLSDGGVHSHIQHILALLQLANTGVNLKNIWLHLFLDGRDTPPQSAAKYIEQLNQLMVNMPKVKVATVSGRYYAMDRDKRYDRLQLAYDAIVLAKSNFIASDPLSALKQSYARSENDEFVKPYVMDGYRGFADGDSCIFANFRADRAVQLTDAIINTNHQLSQAPVKLSAFVTMTKYSDQFDAAVAYQPIVIHNTLGEYIANLGLHQLRIAETEKYPHVTYFFNGGGNIPNKNEDRVIVASPRDVATYDQKPEMSLPEVSAKLEAAILARKYDFIITNFANCDMVGHSGILSAAIKAAEAIDVALRQVVAAMQKIGGEVLVIADHGNCEEMFDYASDQPHTQHTKNLVPCLYIGRNAKIKPGGTLQDVAPTLLAMAGLDKPLEMTGHSLIDFL